MSRISDDYRAELAEMHRLSPKFGASAYKKAQQIHRLAVDRQCETALDYGCGKGTLGPELKSRGIPCQSYDPAVEEFDQEPSPADLVICRDVMEHVEEDCIRDVLNHIHSLANRAVYFEIALANSDESLPGGRNAHITLKKAGEWLRLVREIWARTDIIADSGRSIAFVCLRNP